LESRRKPGTDGIANVLLDPRPEKTAAMPFEKVSRVFLSSCGGIASFVHAAFRKRYAHTSDHWV
jgi:hypothetical protein